jgi:hypothetical protein
MTVSVNGTTGITFNDASTQNTAALGFGFKNRIINGAMQIDQRNAGASATLDTTYMTVDRWRPSRNNITSVLTLQQNAGSVTPPPGFTNYLGFTVTTAQASLSANSAVRLWHFIEGFNTADLAFGTASASSVTLSFWVRSSITGLYGVSLENSASDRIYVASYSINSANTWEYKTITIPGDTTGTWLTDNGRGIRVAFALANGTDYQTTPGSWTASNVEAPTGQANLTGTLDATWYVTGVQLEKGSTATSFDYRPYGTELALCQRYYFKTQAPSSATSPFGIGFVDTTTAAAIVTAFPCEMRTEPTALEQSGTAGDYRVRRAVTTSTTCSSVPVWFSSVKTSATTLFTVASGLTAGQACLGANVNGNAFLAWSAEL